MPGGGPTFGYLSNNEGTFASFFTGLAGEGWVTWLFMLGPLGRRRAGHGCRYADRLDHRRPALPVHVAVGVSADNNPFVDDHLIGVVSLVVLALTAAGDTWGLGSWWRQTSVVQKMPVLR